MNRHAYLIMAHHQFHFLKELIHALDDERNDIYLHIDQKSSHFDFSDLSQAVHKSNLYFTERLNVHWGGYSQIACELTLLRAALPGHYAYYHLLSGSDFPLKTQEEIHAFFEAHAGWEFLHLLLSRLQRLFHVDRLKKESIALQKGANWFSITHEFAEYTLSREDWIEKHFRHSVCADELLLQTLALNSPFMEHIFDPFGDEHSLGNLRYVDWKRGGNNSPYTFQKEDAAFLKSLPHLFARKFEQNIFS